MSTEQDSDAAASRHTNETNSVNPADAGNTADSETELPSPSERAAEFRESYPGRSAKPLTETPGQQLRASLTEETRSEVTVQLPEEDSATTVYELEKRTPLTWEEAVEQLLESHEETKNTTLKLGKGEEGSPEREVFFQPAVDSWMTQYQKQYFAELKGWVREAVGGERPSGGTTDPEFDNPYIVLLTRTASAAPNGDLVSPVDHAEAIADAWEPVYHAIRNQLRALGFDSDDWDYYRKEEPHKSDRGGGINRCYTHEHTFLIVDGKVSARDFAPILEKHVQECDLAGPDAHRVGEAVEVKDAAEVDDLAAYVASYTGIQPMDLSERSTEYVAWAATQWATNSNRRSRSDAAGWAATADACKQRFESPKSEQDVDHGDEIAPSARRGIEYECAACGSPWGIDQDHETLSAARLSAGDGAGQAVADGGYEAPDREQNLRERWPSADAAASVGRSPTEQKKIDRIEAYLKRYPNADVVKVLGGCAPHLGPEDEDLVREVLADVDRSEAVGFDRPPDWELEAVLVGDEEYPADSGGGVDMAEVVKPVDRLLEETRLRHYDEVEQSPTIVVHNVPGEAEYFASHSPVGAASTLVEMGLTEPWAAELHLEFQRRHEDRELADEFQSLDAHPPNEIQS